MDPMLQHHRDATTHRVTINDRAGLLRRRDNRSKLHQEVANTHLPILAAPSDPEAAPIQNDHRRENADRPPRKQIQIEGYEALACTNALALLHMELEPFPVQSDRVDPNVEQYL